MSIRRAKPYVCVDCDFADHPRFLSVRDLEVSAGAWLRCLAYSRAQELDGVVKRAWVKRTFTKKKLRRIEELVAVGLLRVRDDGDYELHAYAPRNQTKAMLDEARSERRDRAARWRAVRQAAPDPASSDRDSKGGAVGTEGESNRDSIGIPTESKSSIDSPALEGSDRNDNAENPKREEHFAEPASSRESPDGPRVTRYKRVRNAFVPTSTSSSTSTSFVFNRDKDPETKSSPEATATRGGAEGGDAPAAGLDLGSVPSARRAERQPLPLSERGMSGADWLAAFTAGISVATGAPCTMPPSCIWALERIVATHAPKRDRPRACAWIREQSTTFAKLWYGNSPGGGLTPQGLERWLNEGRRGPPVFGKPKIVQLPPEEWKMDDFSDLGAVTLTGKTKVESEPKVTGQSNGVASQRQGQREGRGS
jgi:hypothetical protein